MHGVSTLLADVVHAQYEARMPTARAPRLIERLQELSRDSDALNASTGIATLHEALSSRDRLAIIAAAKLIAEHTLTGHSARLAEAYRAIASERGSADPGCFAKEALLGALEAVEHQDPTLFAEAAWHVQLEKSKGGLRDSAANVRARAVLSLARLGHPDLIPIFGARLGDEDPAVRLAAATAIAHRGHRDGAGLLLLRLGAGDPVEAILLECLRALFAVAPDLALQQARTMLQNPRDRDRALQALGTAPSDQAIQLLQDQLSAAALASLRKPIIEALSLSRRQSARSLLLDLIVSDKESDAEVALEALAIHRYDSRLVEQLKAATANSTQLSKLFANLYKQP
jgi:HEAT repeat protein